MFGNNKKEKKGTHEIDLLAKSKLNSIEKIIAKALLDADVSNQLFRLVNNKAENYGRIKKRSE